MKQTLFALCCALVAFLSGTAHAQIGRGDLRLSLDTDMLGIAFVERDPDGPGGEFEATVISVGPNQMGGSRAWTRVATPLGFGLGYAISHRTVLGLRTGLGFDVVDAGDDDNVRHLALSLQPGVTFVPIGRHAKLFINLAGLFQVDRVRHEDLRERLMFGGFAAGIGTLIFTSQRGSVDLGFFFEGRFGGHKRKEPEPETDEDVRDLRVVVRLGFSLWR
jgi:hypothetical protein